MKAVKENKVYSIDEQQKAAYLAQGYDITEDDGTLIQHSQLATVPYAEYEKVMNELNALKAEMAGKADDKSTEDAADKAKKTTKKSDAE